MLFHSIYKVLHIINSKIIYIITIIIIIIIIIDRSRMY